MLAHIHKKFTKKILLHFFFLRSLHLIFQRIIHLFFCGNPRIFCPQLLKFRESFFPFYKILFILKRTVWIALATQPCICITVNFYDVPFCSARGKDNVYLLSRRRRTISIWFLRNNIVITLKNRAFTNY